MTGTRKRLAIALGATLVVAGTGTYAYYALTMKAAPVPVSTDLVQADYTCPMHPSVHLDHPGSCPVCGMTLIKHVQTPAPAAEASPGMEAVREVALSPQQMVTANVTVATVARQALSHEMRAPGKVSFDESRQANVTAWVSGRIDRLYVSRTGQSIRRGQPIAEIYSPDLMTAQQEYLTALESAQALSGASFGEVAHGAHQLLQSARTRLKLLGVSDAQVAQLDRTRRPMVDMTIFSPMSGTVTQKIAQLGQFVGQGQPLFQVADLSRVWVEAPIHEDQLAMIKLGQGADLTAAPYPDQVFRGRISFISPVVDPETRTVQARIELANAGGRLKPEMYVETRIRMSMGNELVVPASAVVDTGTRKVVWVETRSRAFTPREVKLGDRMGDVYPVRSGLAAGERIAATGAYLIDSSSQMRSLGGGSMPGMDMSQSKPDQSMPGINMPAPRAAETPLPDSMPGMKM